ncbi:MAG TPA: DUF5317 family protein [Thermoanaerobaculia bacterium]|nr:DUF5317 family protein [Thermoanaerobaculia bacterium]
MLASAILAGVSAGWLTGGRDLRRLGDVRIRLWSLLALAVALRVLAPLFGELSAIAYVAAFASIAVVALVDRRLPGMSLIAAGATLNCIVVAANGGMPVDPAALAAAGVTMPNDRLHIELLPATRFPQLADVLPLALFRSVYSVGDVLLAAGGFWLPFVWLRRR